MGSCALSSRQAEEQGEVEQMLLMVEEWSFPLQMLDHLPIITALLNHNIHTVKGHVKESEGKQSNGWLRGQLGQLSLSQEIASWKQKKNAAKSCNPSMPFFYSIDAKYIG